MADPVDQRTEPARFAAIVDHPAVPPLAQQAGVLQRAHVLGDRRLRDIIAVRERTYREFARLGDLLEHRAPGRIGQHAHDRGDVGGGHHEQYISYHLYIGKPKKTSP